MAIQARARPEVMADAAETAAQRAGVAVGRIPTRNGARGARLRRASMAGALALIAVIGGAVGAAGPVAAVYLVAALLLSGAFLIGALNWRWSVYGLFLYMPLSGIPIIALYPHTQPAVLAKDFFFVIPCYVGFIAEAILRRRKVSYAGAPTIMLAVLALLVIVQALNPVVPNVLVALIGVKVWLLYLPLVYVGYQLVQSRADLWRLLALIAIPAAIPCAVGLIEAVLIYSGHGATVYGWYGPAASAATQGFFSYSLGTAGAALTRVPSTFSYVAQYYLYTVAMIGVVYAWLRGPLRDRNRSFWGWALLVLVTSASLLSGSRGAFIAAPALLILIMMLDRVGGVRLFVVLGTLAIAFVVALTLIGAQLGPTLSSVAADGSANGGIVFSWIPKAFHLTLTGLGTGLDTGAARYAFPGQSSAVVYQIIGGVWLETWWVKVLVELGLPGLVVALGLMTTVIGGSLRRHLRIADPQLRSVSAALLAVLIWNIIYAVKAQNIDLDPMNVYFWLFAGLLARVYALDRVSAQAAAIPEATARFEAHDRVAETATARVPVG